MNSAEVNRQINARLKNKTYKISSKNAAKILNQANKCKRCKTRNTKRCNLNNYLLYSGAELGKCMK